MKKIRAKIAKLLLVSLYVAEAERLGGATTDNQRRFMKAAVQKGKQMEPVGAMTDSKQ